MRDPNAKRGSFNSATNLSWWNELSGMVTFSKTLIITTLGLRIYSNYSKE